MRRFISLLLVVVMLLIPTCSYASGLSFSIQPRSLSGSSDETETDSDAAEVPFLETMDDVTSLSDDDLYALMALVYSELNARGLLVDDTEDDYDGVVIMDQDGVRVIATNLRIDPDYDQIIIDAIVENNTYAGISLSPEYSRVNGEVVDAIGMYAIESGATVEDYFYFYPASDAGCETLEDIESLEFYFEVYDSETYEDLFKSDFIMLNP